MSLRRQPASELCGEGVSERKGMLMGRLEGIVGQAGVVERRLMGLVGDLLMRVLGCGRGRGPANYRWTDLDIIQGQRAEVYQQRLLYSPLRDFYACLFFYVGAGKLVYF